MRYVTAEQVIVINETQVGPGQLRSRHLLDAAVERPMQSAGGVEAYPGIHEKAAALLQSLARNHPFVDGNKRTAFLSTIVFYGVNEYRFRAPDLDVIHFVIDVAVGSVVEIDSIASQLSGWTASS